MTPILVLVGDLNGCFPAPTGGMSQRNQSMISSVRHYCGVFLQGKRKIQQSMIMGLAGAIPM